jgi:predicted AlkP superfamily pyrophosphatase or phosphodiesterase
MRYGKWVLGMFILILSVSSMGKDDIPQNIILIGWDGAQRNHVKECLAKQELPNLKKLASRGNLVAVDINRVTDTKSGWSQILTGYEPEITGVYSNGRYQPIPMGYSVFERLESHFGSENIVTVAVIGKKGHVDDDAPQKIRLENEPETGKNQKQQPAARRQKKAGAQTPARDKTKTQSAPQQMKTQDPMKKQEGQIIEENGVRYRVIPGKPYYYAKDGMDLFLNGLKTNDNVGSQTLSLLEKYKNNRFFFFVHLAEVDHMGHTYGENSKEYNDALISCDIWLGRIMEKLKELKLGDKTLVYVTADHGFDEGRGSHTDAPYVFLATNDTRVMRRGERADITPTILDRFGLDLGKLDPPLNGRPLTKPYTPPLW